MVFYKIFCNTLIFFLNFYRNKNFLSFMSGLTVNSFYLLDLRPYIINTFIYLYALVRIRKQCVFREIFVCICVFTLNSFRYNVRVGEWQTNTEIDCGEEFCGLPVQDVPISHIVVHPGYEKQTYQHNIALLVLRNKINYTGEINIYFYNGFKNIILFIL